MILGTKIYDKQKVENTVKKDRTKESHEETSDKIGTNIKIIELKAL